MDPTLKKKKGIRPTKKGTRPRGQQSGLAPAHAVGGPATISGVDFEIDCALLDVFELVQSFLSDPLSDRELRPQPRVGPTTELTAWDYDAGDCTLVEAKRNATWADVAEWLTRSARAYHAMPAVRFRLVYGAATGPGVDSVDRLVRLAGEAESDARLRELVAHDRVPHAPEIFGLIPPQARAFLVRIELVAHDPRTLVDTLTKQALALFEAKPQVVLAVSRDVVRSAARARGYVRASAFVSDLRSNGCRPRNLSLPIRLEEADAARVAVFLLSACQSKVPRALLAAVLELEDSTLRDKLAPTIERGLISAHDEVLSLSPQCPRVTAVDGAMLLGRLLDHGLASLDRGDAWTASAASVRSLAEICICLAPAFPAQVGTAFRVLDKPLKNLGDVGLVRATADACVAAARSAKPSTDEIRRGEAQALICGAAWAKQRSGHIHEARADGELSLRIGEALQWDRNTAFCRKCLGRLLRLEAGGAPDAHRRAELLQASVSSLRQAIDKFEALTELSKPRRLAEVGASYSLLGRTFLELDDRNGAQDAIEQARARIPNEPGKDLADLWILQGEFSIRWGDPKRALTAFSCAIDAATPPGYEVTEMLARAYEQRARVAPKPAEDMARAVDLYRHLKDAESAARAEFEGLRLAGVVPQGLVERLTSESHRVALASARVFQDRLNARGSRAAYRGSIPAAVFDDCIEVGRRRAVIEDGSAVQLTTSTRVRTGVKPKPGVKMMLDAARELVPATRSTYAAACALATELTENIAGPPVDLGALAARLGVKEIRAAELIGTGDLDGEPGNFIIRYSTQVPSQRARFTVAHELGHALLFSRGQNVSEGKELETFCDEFAGVLLVPDRFLPGELPLPVTVGTVRDVARRFDVSLSAAVRRLCRYYRTFEVFCIRSGAVQWSAGTVPRGSVAAIALDLQRLVKERLETGRCSTEVYASTPRHTGMWVVDSVDTGPGGTIFILSPTIGRGR